MTFQGIVKNGVVVLDTDSPPAEGTRVTVEVDVRIPPEDPADDWADVVMKFAGLGRGMPPDMAAQHDHYIHGTPKR